LGDFATLASLVSVIDGADFLRRWREDRSKKDGREVLTTHERPVFELLLEQAECADLLLINKCDLIRPDEADELESILRGLNARAEIVRAEQSRVDADFLLGRVRFDAQETLRAAAWLESLSALLPAAGSASGLRSPFLRSAAAAARPSHEEKYGIRSFVFQARRPFEARKFFALIEGGLPGLLRAKGYFWTQERPDEMGFLSVAGGATSYDFLSYWWAAMVENGRVGLEHRPELIVALWAEPHGDRRQELVFIGVGLEEAAIRAGLTTCPVQSVGGAASAC